MGRYEELTELQDLKTEMAGLKEDVRMLVEAFAARFPEKDWSHLLNPKPQNEKEAEHGSDEDATATPD